MHMLLRTVLVMLRARRRSPLTIEDVGRLSLRVYPTDIDLLKHLNNGVYFSMLDLGRFDLMVRAGIWKQLTARGWYPVSVSETITFRRSVKTWQRFTIETRMLGYDDRATFVEQQVVIGGEIYARAIIKARFLKRSGGIVTIDELRSLDGGAALTAPLPAWVDRWSKDVALPSTKEPFTSDWA